MNDSISSSEHTGSTFEQQSFVLFQEELRRVARFITTAVPADPLEAVLKAIRQNPAMSQARLLTRILAAYIGRQVSFRSAEVSTFDREHLALLVALMDTHDAGTLARVEWERAADEADATQRQIDS